MTREVPTPQCPHCGPTSLEPHPRLPIQRCSNCKEHLPAGASPVTPEDAREWYFYPDGIHRMACYPDNDGYPQCMGDGSFCGYSSELDAQVCVHLPADPADS